MAVALVILSADSIHERQRLISAKESGEAPRHTQIRRRHLCQASSHGRASPHLREGIGEALRSANARRLHLCVKEGNP
jgi:hypothetical protein